MEATQPVEVLGIDAGGTMTDTFFIRPDGSFVVGKAQTTPQDEREGILRSASDALKQWGLDLEQAFPGLANCVYSGTTMLNRIVQRQGANVGLIVNRGMEDFPPMRAVQSFSGYSYEDRIHVNTHRFDPPLVPRQNTRGVTERINGKAEVVIPLREDEARQAARELIALDVDSIVISLLQSYHYTAHERRVRDICREVAEEMGSPDLPVFASCDYYPHRKESSRTNTIILEAYAAEPSRQTLAEIDARFRELGTTSDLLVMASHGGTVSWKAKELARTVVSGPIGGVIGAKYIAEYVGQENIVCTDLGGTSFDIALITGGALTIQQDPEMARLVLALPLVEMDSVGAGSGSYLRINPYTDSLQIGPTSAGYRVGMCWEEGGVDTVTVTDCHVVLGHINPDNFLGGDIKLDYERAQKFLKEQIADPLGFSVEEAASGVLELVNFNLRQHLRSAISAKGYEPSEFVCISYGGAGPLHTYGYTGGMGFRDVIVPAWAAGFSAFGSAAAEYEYRYDKSLFVNLDLASPDEAKTAGARVLQDAWDELSEHVYSEFEVNGYSRDKVTLKNALRMQYQGQLNDLEIDAPIPRTHTVEDWDRLTDAFQDRYGEVYAHAARSPELGVSVTAAIMRGTVDVAKPSIVEEELAGAVPPTEAMRGERRFFVPTKREWVMASIYEIEQLKSGNTINGPAVLESPATCFVVPPGFTTRLDERRLFHLQETSV
jgi:acetone carboxylase, beta subunit